MNATFDDLQEKEESLNFSGGLGIPGNTAKTIPEEIDKKQRKT